MQKFDMNINQKTFVTTVRGSVPAGVVIVAVAGRNERFGFDFGHCENKKLKLLLKII